MSNIHIRVSGVDAAVTDPVTLTAGMVGATATFTCAGSDWQDLTRIAVFRAGGVCRNVADWDGDTCLIPWECLQAAGEPLLAGIYGTDSTGALVIPTVYADCGVIQPGADPTGDPSAQPSEPFFAALMARVLAQAQADGVFDGADGVSPTVTLQNTYAAGLIPAVKVTITDKDGDHIFTIKDGKAGKNGTAGVHGDSVQVLTSELSGTEEHPNGGYQITFRQTTYPASGGSSTISSQSLPLWHGADGDISLGITGAAAGQTLKVAAVDENGAPIAWEVV